MTDPRKSNKLATKLKFKKARVGGDERAQDSGTSAMRYGMVLESFVFEQLKTYFEENAKKPVTKCGFMIHPTYDYIGATPDGLIGDDTVLEIKCVYADRGHQKRPSWIEISPRTGLYTLDHQHRYYYQVQGEMMCSGRQYAVLAVYHQRKTDVAMYMIMVKRDQAFIDTIQTKLIKFYHQYYIKVVSPPVSPNYRREVTANQ
jgi:hypothetical protein